MPWITLGREVEAARERLEMLRRDASNIASRAERAHARERYLREAAVLDKLLQEYAFAVPVRHLERGRLLPHIAAKHIEEACLT